MCNVFHANKQLDNSEKCFLIFKIFFVLLLCFLELDSTQDTLLNFCVPLKNENHILLEWGWVNDDDRLTSDGHDFGQKSEHVAWLKRWKISKTEA